MQNELKFLFSQHGCQSVATITVTINIIARDVIILKISKLEYHWIVLIIIRQQFIGQYLSNKGKRYVLPLLCLLLPWITCTSVEPNLKFLRYETNMSASVVVWEWEEAPNLWLPYDAKVCEFIESHYVSSSNNSRLNLGQVDRNLIFYDLNLTRLVQIRLETGKYQLK